ncbi:MAG: inner membrane-spanning protein YciB [Hyphomicrobiales bacterium]
MSDNNTIHPGIKLLIDIGPLLLFFVVDRIAGIFWACGTVMAASAIAVITQYVLTKEIPILPGVTALFVLVFGGLTLFLGDENFVKMEVSITNALCGALLLGGLAFRKSLLKIAFGEVAELPDNAWKKLTFRMGIFLLSIAILNEMARAYLSTDDWVFFRVYGILGLSALFFALQAPMLREYMLEADTEE